MWGVESTGTRPGCGVADQLKPDSIIYHKRQNRTDLFVSMDEVEVTIHGIQGIVE